MKISVFGDNLNWIVDEQVNDFKKYTKHEIVSINQNPDVLWSISSGGFGSIARYKLKKYVTVHHVDETKVGNYPFGLFNMANGCIVPNKITEEFLKTKLSIPIYRIPYWLLSSRMIQTTGIKSTFAEKDEIVIGFFQKDSEGDSNQPKLSKGPDTFLEIVKILSKKFNIRVLLAGYSRKYLIENFQLNNIKYTYLERYKNMNELYDSIDWYFITSRYEGGPQSVLETSYKKIKVLSTNVGIALGILHSECICNDVNEFVKKFEQNLDKTKENFNIIQNFLPDVGIKKFDYFFEKMQEIT